jgi:hypothetical protein
VGQGAPVTPEEIAAWIQANPTKVRRLPSPPSPTDAPQVAEQFDRVQIGNTWGTYRRKKHKGSDEQ